MAARRIAIVSMHTCPLEQPGSGDSGGMNVYVLSLAHALARRGIQSDIFTRRANPLSARVVVAGPGVRVFHVDAGEPEPIPKEALPLLGPAFIAGVSDVVANCGAAYDAVHSHYWVSARAGRSLAGKWGVPHVLTFHSLAQAKNLALSVGEAPEPGHRIGGEIRAVAGADHVVASTEHEASMLVSQYGACRGRLSVVAPGVDTTIFVPGDREPARKRAGLAANVEDFTLVVAGRIQPLKGFDVAISALGALQSDEALAGRVRLVVVGGPSGPSGVAEAAALRDLAVKHGVAESVDFRSPVPQAKLADFYRSADLVLMPSRSESFGLVALEAQAAGTPVVASSAGGLPEVVRDGVTGTIVDPLEPTAFAAAIGRLLLDSAGRASMGRKAAGHARKFSWSSTAEKISRIYDAHELIEAAESVEGEETAEVGAGR